MVEAGKKAAITRRTATYSVEQHKDNLQGQIMHLFDEVRDVIIAIDGSIEEAPKQNYIAYKTSQNFGCLQTSKKKLTLFLKINPKEFNSFPHLTRDVSEIGHFGTGDFELTIRNSEEFEQTKHLILEAYKNIGG